MFKILIIGTGGFLGSVFRFGLIAVTERLAGQSTFPFGTLVVNILGCFMIGFLNGFVETRTLVSNQARAFLFVGVLGGFTTFSTFGIETFTLGRYQGLGMAAANTALHILLGLSAVWGGLSLARNW